MSLRENLVDLQAGRVEGVESADGAVRIFRGVPYAKPPMGGLRWRPPQAVEPWSGVRSAREFGPCCVQPPRPKGSVSDFGIETCHAVASRRRFFIWLGIASAI
jgi:para-nitrobenzyl esterase